MSRHTHRLWMSFCLLAVLAPAANAQVVISQVYGGGGNSGAPYKSDFIELFNAGATPVSLAGYSVQYTSATGTGTWAKTDLSGSLQPGQYYLVKEADGAGTQAALPTPDAIGTLAMSGTAGKVALVANTTLLTGACPAALDLVGFGPTANCPVAPNAPTAVLSNTTAAIRKTAGCTNAGNNSADFAVAAPTPRNTGTAFNLCGGGGGPPNLAINDVTLAEGDSGTKLATFTISLSSAAGIGGVSFDIATVDGSATTGNNDYVANGAIGATIAEGATSTTFAVTINGDADVESDETFTVNLVNVVGANALDVVGLGTIQNDDFTIVPVHAIQGSGAVSPYAINTIVATEGIVTARTSNGFFMQTPDAEADLDATTSEGVFVFTSTAPPASAAVGNRVRVNATLDEYNPGGQLPLTELKNATVVQLSAGNPLPAAIELVDADANATSTLDRLERYEGMRVSIASLKVVAPVDGNINEASATSSSNGIFYGVLPTVARPLREPGIDVLDPIVPPAGVVPPVFDHNPELIRVRSTGQTGAPNIAVDVGDAVNGLVGVLDYGFAAYTVTPDPTPAATVVLGSQATAVPVAASDEITIGGFNLLHFFDDIADGNGATKLTTVAYQQRLKKTANAICAFTRNPDILGVVEVEHIKALGELATSINTLQGNVLFPGSCAGNPAYQAYLIEGNDVGGIDVGFLLKTAEVAPGKPRVEVVSIDQIGKDALFTNADNSTELLNDRPPFVLVARINNANGASQTVTVIANHLRSLIDVSSTAVGTKGWPTVGARVRAKRGEQARFLAQLIQDRQSANPDEKIVLLGDFNAFEFNDGLVDSMGIVTGREAGPTEVIRYIDSPITTPLTNTATLAPATERYSFSFDGNAQSLDHMVVNQAVLDDFAGVRAEHARINADFGIDNYGDFTVPVRVSDHDPVVLFLGEASFRTTALSVDVIENLNKVIVGDDAALAINVFSTGENPVSPAKLDLRISSFAPPAVGTAAAITPDLVVVSTPSGWTCGTPVADGPKITVVHCTSDTSTIPAASEFSVSVHTSLAFDQNSVIVAAAIASSGTDTNPADNSDSSSRFVWAPRDLKAVVSGPTVMKVGGSYDFQATVENQSLGVEHSALVWIRVFGPASLVKKIESDFFDCASTYAQPNDSLWSCVPKAGFGTDYAAGQIETLHVTIVPTFLQSGRTLKVQAVFQSAQQPYLEPNPGNNLYDLLVPVQSVRFVSPPTTPPPVPID